MPVLKKTLDAHVADQILQYAKEKNGNGGYAFTYAEIAASVGHDVSKDDVSALCLQHDIRRKHRGTIIRQSEDSILSEIKQLHEKLSILRQRVVVVWNLTGKKFSVENCQGKSDAEIVQAVRNFLSSQRNNRDGLH